MYKMMMALIFTLLAVACSPNTPESPSTASADASVDASDARSGTNQNICGSMTSLTSAGAPRAIGPFPSSTVARVRNATGVFHWNADTPRSVSQRRFGTGVLIGPRILITAAHNLDANIVLNGAVPGITTPSDVCARVHLDFGFVQPNGSDPVPLVNGHEGQSYACERVLSNGVGGLDVAVLLLRGSPGSTWGYLPVSTEPVRVGTSVLLVGTPTGLPLFGAAGQVLRTSEDSLFYDADTIGGFSGCGVVDARGLVLGVHRAGNCSESDVDASADSANYGTPMNVILDRDPTLRVLIAGERCGRSAIDCLCAAGSDNRAQSQCLANNLECSQCVNESFQNCCGVQVSTLQSCSRLAGCNDGACVSSRCSAESRALNECWSAAQQNRAACVGYFAACFGQYPISCG